MLISVPYMLILGGGWGWIALALAECIAFGFISRAIMKSKNREGGFAWGFFLAGIGLIICATKRRIVYEPPTRSVSDYLSDKPLVKKEIEPPKPVTWKCVKCGKDNAQDSAFCTECGERRHYNWICAQCGRKNDPAIRFCPDCGNAWSEEQEKCVRNISSDEDFLEHLRSLSSATEIADAFEEKFGSDDNDDARTMISRLQKAKISERSYGNMKSFAIKLVEAFYNHGMRIYTVDRSYPTLACPVCGKMQRNDRESCFGCGALFRD